jgi:hypothetical protein
MAQGFIFIYFTQGSQRSNGARFLFLFISRKARKGAMAQGFYFFSLRF